MPNSLIKSTRTISIHSAETANDLQSRPQPIFVPKSNGELAEGGAKPLGELTKVSRKTNKRADGKPALSDAEHNSHFKEAMLPATNQKNLRSKCREKMKMLPMASSISTMPNFFTNSTLRSDAVQ